MEVNSREILIVFGVGLISFMVLHGLLLTRSNVRFSGWIISDMEGRPDYFVIEYMLFVLISLISLGVWDLLCNLI